MELSFSPNQGARSIRSGTVTHGLSQKEAGDAARGCMAKFDRGRWLLIRLIEVLAFPVIRGLDRLLYARAIRSEAVEKVLVIECGQLGDIALASAFLKNLRIHYTDAHIALAADPRVFPLVESEELVNELIPILVPWGVGSSRWRRYNVFSAAWMKFVGTVRRLRRQSFDVAMCARADIRDNFFVWLSGARRRIGYAFYGGGLFLTDAVTPNLDHPHYSRRWLDLLDGLGKPVLYPQTRLSVKPAEKKSAEHYLAERGVRSGDFVIGIHSGARVRTRQWGREKFQAVGERLTAQFDVKILWFEEPNERLRNDVQGRFVQVSLPLRQFLGILSQCNLLICNDSGPLHIAEALGVPVVAVFGPNEPAWFGPVGCGSRTIIHEGFWCRPCGDRCIFNQPFCLSTISVERVFRAALECISEADLHSVRRGANLGNSVRIGKNGEIVA